MELSNPFLPQHFINRELSWLEFNARVLEEAQDASNPLLERVKFLAIFSSNLDEFFMVRVAGLREQAFGGVAAQDIAADGFNPIMQLLRIWQRTKELVIEQYECFNHGIVPSLAEHGIQFLNESDLDKKQRKVVDEFFQQRAFPILTPMAIDPSHPSPRFHNRGLYLVSQLRRTKGLGPADLFAVVQLPQVLPRFLNVGGKSESQFVLLEDILAAKLPELFGGYEIENHAAFRITRDMDYDLLEQEGDDMLQAIEQRLRERNHSESVRLEVQSNIGRDLLNMIVKEEKLKHKHDVEGESYSEIYRINGMLDLTSLWQIVGVSGYENIRQKSFTPREIPKLNSKKTIFSEIANHDILLHHPFDSFNPVVRFIESAAEDENVLAIKQTLYRTSGDSPIVRALIQAAENGKHVTALVELKARFDEANNIDWARQMERAGVHVVYGFMDLKTHCKLALVVRQEGKKVRRYVHLGTGNYNPQTATLYTDMGLFTANRQMAEDVSALFNFLTGYSQGHEWRKLVVAPQDLQRRTIELIKEQAERARQGKSARIFAKLNSLADRKTIEALYVASQAGVNIDLVIRGVCCLRPGLPGISETITVRSIVDRLLEHSRILVFGEGPKAQVYLSSADWMPRNFNRRVEVMFPIEDPNIKKHICQHVLPIYLRDNSRARTLLPNGSYTRPTAWHGEETYRSQIDLLERLDLQQPLLQSPNNQALNGAATEGDKEKKKERH